MGSEFQVVFIAILGDQNEPVVMRKFGDVDECEMQLSIYAAMDIIQEQVVLQQHSDNDDIADPYLGFICPTLVGECFYKIHAYMAATCFKIIAVFNNSGIPSSKIRTFFENIHELYSNTICNPLILRKVETPNFINKLGETVE